MTLVWPHALLLLLPLGLWLWWKGRVRAGALALRALLVLVLVLALARPEVTLDGGGSDVLVVVDRSRSMPPGSLQRAEELVRLVEGERRPGDRVGVLSFGRTARVDQPPSAEARFGGFTAAVDGEASSLAAALDAAGEVIPPDRTGRVLVVSDGRATGADARGAARRLWARGIAVDYRLLARDDAALDVAVTGLQVAAAVSAKEPFLLQATLKASAPVEVSLTLQRGGRAVVKTTRALRAGDNLLTFRDLVDEPGLAAYELRVDAAGDGVPENDVGRAVVRVEGPPRLLVLTDRPQGVLVQALRQAGLEPDARVPFPLTLDVLDGVGAVVLEDVEAGRLSEGGLRVLAQYVKEAGGGLLMTGGQHSFGEGGYRKSPVEDVLPVSLEIREEQRRAAVAMSIIMDCSCSMGMQVPDGRTKMEVAAEGVVGALQLLDLRDEAAVNMVDTSPHEIFGLSPVSEGLPLGKVARGFSGGGGIYVGVGLRTAKKEILKSDKPTRHVLLFSDAADSEEPDDYKKTLSELRKEGVTVSVIGLGSPKDQDADLLREVAALGGGRMHFAEDAMSLPRIFSQETIAVARATFVDVATPVKVLGDLAQLGRQGAAAPPKVGGYNLTYLRPQASAGLRTTDGNEAPLLAFWPRGAGRVVALAAEVDGKYTGEWATWPGRRALLEQAVRWVAAPRVGPIEAVPRAQLLGGELHVTLDFDASAPPPVGTPTLVLLSGDGSGQTVELPMQWEDEDRVGAKYALPGSGTWHALVKLDGRVWRAPPVTLPWAPEFEPVLPGEGRRTLEQVAKAGNGQERLSMSGVFAEGVQSQARLALAPWLVALAVALLVAEVFLRRFLSGRVPRLKPRFARTVSSGAVPVALGPAPLSTSTAARPQARGAVPDAREEAPPAPPPAAEPPPPSGVASALEEARARAKKRTGR